ncbi:BRCT domain-containing protein [Ascobolus immersus RN42]|uniref:BRCT domain-containing protein n=1 Tax=Ascobolus immersus RN42 TaxID=1160509 RepID=A0A3N4IAH1_ASCIM|nr:BRCT domain-containing protein [Ascobolus immersus RN42]
MAEEPNARPLANVTLCSTGLTPDQRTEMTDKASVMGAQVGMDFTTTTTHLVVTNSFSPKYKFVAKHRADVVVVDLEWINEIHALWTAGEDVNVRAMEEKHKLPTFFGLKVCVTTFMDDERAEIIQMLTDNGAEYHPDLTKDVTHLIAPEAAGKKYHFARKWKIQICGPEWIRDSIERGMILDEACYDLRLPEEQRGLGAKPEIPKPPPAPVETNNPKAPVANMHPPDASGSSVPAGSMTRKLRRHASNAFGSQAADLFNEIMGHGPAPKEKKRDVWEDDAQQDAVPAFEETADTSNVPPIFDSGVPLQEEAKAKTGIYANRNFFLHKFPQKQATVLQETIESLDGIVYLDLEEFFDSTKNTEEGFLLIPPELGREDCPDIPEDCRVTVVRYWWIEICMFEKRFLDPAAFGRGYLYKPLSNGNIEGFSKMNITITGFANFEMLHVMKYIKLLGANFSDLLKKDETTLVIKNPRSPINASTLGGKLGAAQLWNIPVVDLGWLWDCSEQDKRLPLGDYLVRLPRKRKHYEDSEETIADESYKRRNNAQLDPRRDLSEVRTVRQSPSGRSDAGQTSHRPRGVAANGGERETIEKEQVARNFDRKTVLAGTIVCVGSTLRHRKDELEDIAELLGAKVVECFTAKDIHPITHLIHKSPRLDDRTRDYRTAKQIRGCAVVSPDWLKACQKYRKRLDESAYPPITSAIGTLTISKDPPKYTSPVKQRTRLPLAPSNRLPKKSELNIVSASEKMDVDSGYWEYQSAPPKQSTPFESLPQEETPPAQPPPHSSATIGRRSPSPTKCTPAPPTEISPLSSPARPPPVTRQPTKTPSPRKPNPISSILKNLTAPQILSLVDAPSPANPPRRKFTGRALSTLSNSTSLSNPAPPSEIEEVGNQRRNDTEEDGLEGFEGTQTRVTYGDDPQSLLERQKIWEALSGKKIESGSNVVAAHATVKVQDVGRRTRHSTRRL